MRRGVAEAREHYRIGGERQAGPPEPPGDADRKGGADRLGQVRGDGRGLRRNGERPRPDDLVPPARDRVLARRREAEQPVPVRRQPRHLSRALELEGGGTVLEKGHVGYAEGHTEVGERGEWGKG